MQKLLQCGFPRSGNTLLWNILFHYQKLCSSFRSFAEGSGLKELMVFYESHRCLASYTLVDKIHFSDGKAFFIYPNPHMRHLEINLKMLLDNASLIWTHCSPASFVTIDNMANIDNMLYICRNPLAVYVSLCHYIVRPEYIKLFPDSKLKTVEEVMEREDFVVKWARRWKEHVQSYIQFQDQFKLIRYEDLVINKLQAVAEVLAWLDPNLTQEALNAYSQTIAKETDLKKMQQESPEHVRKGSINGWQNEITASAKAMIQEIAFSEMTALGYKGGE